MDHTAYVRVRMRTVMLLLWLLSLAACASSPGLFAPTSCVDSEGRTVPGSVVTRFRSPAGVQGPEPLVKPPPQYDYVGDKCEKGALVTVRAILRTNGELCGVEVLEAPPGCSGFVNGVLDTVAQWRFKPAMRRGQPIAIHYNLQVRRQ